ncbi:flagellin N-terminal helical domain-containing protein [Paenibacillus senegalimassiliensis]|uniref:flagellin N-terminal helical domain-containing protein n=1 Tax=Paenibacillus senegalimassiliensis TaxID=1737426 RepID=UPI00073E8229|nr:flagellin [Paenibacillus senegalimassiliensis]
MGMFINTNVGAINANRNLNFNNTQMSKTMEKLSSGYRINRAADDAAGLAISEKMIYQINGLNQAQRNAQDGISLLQTAEGDLTEVHSMLQRMNTLANQSANGTYQAEDRANLQAEVDQLITEIDRIVTGSNFNGVSLLNADAAANGVSFQIGVTGETQDTLTVTLADNSAATLLGAATLDISTDAAAAKNALETIKTAIETVSTNRAELGAYQNRLEHTINSLGVTSENLSAANSRIKDADMATEMTTFTKNQILVQAGTAMLAQANSAPQSVLKLLG